MLRQAQSSTLFPYTTLFRSRLERVGKILDGVRRFLRLRDPVVQHCVDVDRHVESDVRRSEEHTSELQSLAYLVCRLLLEKKKIDIERLHASVRRLRVE